MRRLDDKFWDIFNRNMISGVHKTEGESRPRDVRAFIYWLKEHNLWWDGSDLLNVGIGDCQEAVLLAQAGLDVTGISNSLDEVTNAHEVRDELRLTITAYKLDAHQMAFPNDAFHYVYMHDTMEHFIAPIMVFTQCRRVLKMGGILAFHYPTATDALNWTHWFMESPDFIFTWLMKFGFRLQYFTYEPGASSEFFYIAQKVPISEELLEKGGNVVIDMLRELTQLLEENR